VCVGQVWRIIMIIAGINYARIQDSDQGGETNRRTRNPHPGYRILDSMQVSYSEHSRRQPQSPSRSCFRWLLCGALGKLSLCHVCVTAQSSKQGVPSAMPSHAFPSAATVRMRDMQMSSAAKSAAYFRAAAGHAFCHFTILTHGYPDTQTHKTISP